VTMRILLLLAVVAACNKGKSEPAATKASCHTSASQSCEEYESTGKAYLDSRSKDCKQIAGVWSTTACPTAGLLGSCRETTPNWTRTRHYYAGASIELEKTKAECGAFGKWIEPAKP